MPDTESLLALIMKRFPSESWALMYEVADATGARHSRWADAVAMGLWPSRGLDLHGMEIKASRSDWLRELKKPAKAETICSFCHYWWLVAADSTVVKMEELPHTWGLLIPHGGSLKTVKQAPRLDPKPVTPVFLAALMRAACKPAATANAKALQAEFWRGQKDEKERAERHSKGLEKAYAELQRQVTEFEVNAGFRITSWGQVAGKVGQTVRAVLNGEHDRDAADIEQIRQTAADIVARIDFAKSKAAEVQHA